MEPQKTIFILVVPAYGHINPLTCLAYELIKNKNARVVFYGIDEHKELIEKSGAEFRNYAVPPKTGSMMTPNGGLNEVIGSLIDSSYFVIPELIKDFERDQPDLIIYDLLSIHTKYFVDIIRNRYERKISTQKPPQAIRFLQSFAILKDVYPVGEESKLLFKKNGLVILNLILLIFKQLIFNFYFGLTVFNPISYVLKYEDLNIVSVFPELHPRSEFYNKTFKFVGVCVSEKTRKSPIKDEKLKDILDKFDPINPKNSTDFIKTDDLKLIYASLGTVFNNNFFVFETIINAIKNLDQDGKKFRLIISTGKTCYEKFQNKIKNENYMIPDNILLLPSAPQIDILERASLFITHAGMNSSSEAIDYGVPVVCIPIMADQPLVAHRLCDQLKLGIMLDPDSLTEEKLKDSINKVLDDKSYLERMLQFSKISRKYDGKSAAANIVMEYLQNVEKKTQ